ncbi:hypothetical protein Poli38472_014700 [Pythium oligandrum]|uniref:Amino acid transporter n=1 Tax=Pythium oligandrum TaxID=41045 RepID=A0A8K1CJV1_PYTOL|nr:hypothetical protein Poli38472_014700 [Pythium oligandrum]|eukprot:TMW63995.1 hypothetical protein Poli38472_014700 [Pythium oligandrum]
MENSRRPRLGGIQLLDEQQQRELADVSTIGGLQSHSQLESRRRDAQPRTDFTSFARRPTLINEDAMNRDTGILDTGAAATQSVKQTSRLHISVSYIMVGLLFGVLLGVALYEFEASPLVASWVSLPGELFLRVLKCLVVPYVFCAVAVSIGDIVYVGKVSIIGVQTLRVFVMFWLATTAMGIGLALLFRHSFQMKNNLQATSFTVGFQCKGDRIMVLDKSGNVTCSDGQNMTSEAVSAAFQIVDTENVFKKNDDASIKSLSDQLMETFNGFVSQNIVSSLASGHLPSVITFAMALGTIAGRNFFDKTRRVNYLYMTLLQLRNAFFLALEWIIWLSPGAVISLVAGSFASNQTAVSQFLVMYVYVLVMALAGIAHMGVILPLVVFLLSRCNPYNHMKHMIRAYVFAFGCSSSLATAPVTLGCIQKAKICTPSVANFVISLGVCSNSSASGWYYPVAIAFLAESSGAGDQLTPLRFVALFVLAALAAAATPAIPAGGLILTTTFYRAVVGVPTVPSTYPLLVAMDFFVDRIVTVCNVNDDIMALKVIAENTDETVSAEYLGQRF